MNEIIDAVASHGDTLGISAMLVTVLSILFRSLATGSLVFKKQLDELRADKDAEMVRTVAYYDKLIVSKGQQIDDYRGAYQNSETARATQAATLETLLELARASNHALQSLPTSRPAGRS